MPPGEALALLEAKGLLRRDGVRWRTTRRWQAAMMRAAASLVAAPQAPEDLRVPVASALVDLFQDLPARDIATLVMVLAPIEAAELLPGSAG